MRDRDIDEAIHRAASAVPEVDPALLDRIAQSLGGSLRPVRPLPPPWVLGGALVVLTSAAALTGGALLGLHGLQKMSPAVILAIFPVLGVLCSLGATVCAREMIPGSRRRIAPWLLLTLASLAMTTVFALLFRGYALDRFVAEGVPCLTTGLLLAVPVAAGCWLVLRRGMAVHPSAAGLAVGALAGLAGLATLELHCPNFKAVHVMVWHTAVPLLSGVVGAFVVWAWKRAA